MAAMFFFQNNLQKKKKKRGKKEREVGVLGAKCYAVWHTGIEHEVIIIASFITNIPFLQNLFTIEIVKNATHISNEALQPVPSYSMRKRF